MMVPSPSCWTVETGDERPNTGGRIERKDDSLIEMTTKSKLVWAWLGLLIAADLVVPWHVVGREARFTGPFLFWVIWTIVAIASMFLVFRRWSS